MIMCRKATLALLPVLFLLSCVYGGELEKDFYVSAVQDFDKLPLEVSIVKSRSKYMKKFQASAGGYGVDIDLGDSIISGLNVEFGKIFGNCPGAEPAVTRCGDERSGFRGFA